MIYPKFIKDGSIIGVTAPSDGITEEIDIKRLDFAKDSFNNLGYKVVETQNVRTNDCGRSSSAYDRARQLESLFLDKNVDLVMCVSGGDFLLEMVSEVDYSIILDNPKLLQGYSDPTGLLFTITTNLDIATIYSDNFMKFGMRHWHKSLENNLEILKGNIVRQNSFSKYEKDYSTYIVGDEGYNLTEEVYWKNLNGEKSIKMKGRIIGGCLDILNDLFGTRFDKTKEFIEKYKPDGIIWYLDNCELSNDQLIRTLWKFSDNGYFKYAKGIIFGRSTTDVSSYGVSFSDAVKTALSKLNVPIIIDSDIGHVSPRMTIINGAVATITSENGKGTIEFELE